MRDAVTEARNLLETALACLSESEPNIGSAQWRALDAAALLARAMGERTTHTGRAVMGLTISNKEWRDYA